MIGLIGNKIAMQFKLAAELCDLVTVVATVYFLVLAGWEKHIMCTCTAAAITSNIDGSVCPGDNLVYTCVGQGTSQRWRINKHGVFVEHILIYKRRRTRKCNYEKSVQFHSAISNSNPL